MQKKITLRLFLALSLALMQTNAFAQVPSQEAYVNLNSTGVNVPVPLTNITNGAKSIEYTLTRNGEVIETKTIALNGAGRTRSNQTLNVVVPPSTDPTVDELALNITKVNGQPTNTTEPYTTITRTTLTQTPKRKVVVEDFTGMWCPWCPRGMAVLSYLTRTHPNDFIGIAVHNSDALECDDYSGIRVSGYPTVRFDRRTDTNDYTGESTFRSEQNRGAEMDVKVFAAWDEWKRNISITTRTTFRVSKYNSHYALAYVLLADGLQSRSYYQKNGFAGNYQYRGYSQDLDFFVNSSNPVYNLKFDHTAIAALGITRGLQGSISTPIVADKVQVHQTAFKNISQYSLIQDKSKLSVCVLVINTQTGEIVNADKCEISDHTSTGIENAPTTGEVVEVARYNAAGCRISQPTHGLNIVKYSDGRTVKEIVK